MSVVLPSFKITNSIESLPCFQIGGYTDGGIRVYQFCLHDLHDPRQIRTKIHAHRVGKNFRLIERLRPAPALAQPVIARRSPLP